MSTTVLADPLLSPQQVCDIVPGITLGGLAQMRYRGDGPRFIKPSQRKVVYRRSAIDEWLVASEKTSTRPASSRAEDSP